jgi:hypothetical protein
MRKEDIKKKKKQGKINYNQLIRDCFIIFYTL